MIRSQKVQVFLGGWKVKMSTLPVQVKEQQVLWEEIAELFYHLMGTQAYLKPKRSQLIPEQTKSKKILQKFQKSYNFYDNRTAASPGLGLSYEN